MIDWSLGSGRISVSGKSLEWGSFGPRPGVDPVIVMLHEGLGCLALWRDFPQRLVEHTGFPVFAYSRAGYGQSDSLDAPWPLDYMEREAIHSLPKILAAINADSCILLGHSDGASIAAVYAGRVNDPGLRGVILMAPHFFTEPMGLAEIAAAREVFETTDMRERMAKYHRDPEAAFRGWNNAWLHPDFQSWNIEQVIEGFRVPSLAVQGAQDQYGTVRQVEVVKRRSPAPVTLKLLEDCRHSLHLDQLDATLAAIDAFVQPLEKASRQEIRHEHAPMRAKGRA